MRLMRIRVRRFRSIEDVEIIFPENVPVVLFGPNNVGKSNVLKALDMFLGERWTPNAEFADSDHFQRDKDAFPTVGFEAEFDETFYAGNSYSPATNTICFSTNHRHEDYRKGTVVENAFHYPNGDKMFLSQEDRGRCEFVLIDAVRDIGRHLSYYSKYSILSRMSYKMHKVLVAEKKDELKKHFDNVSGVFKSVPEFSDFMTQLQESVLSSLDGFEHKLEIDLSAYDPNNYFHSLRIIAKEGGEARSFEEFGTGEQQILLMSFFKAFAEVFKGNRYILGIEEPEANLHPLAQKWLAKHIDKMASEGLQVIMTTHSPHFLRMADIEGMVKVTKASGVTQTKQLDRKKLAEWFLSKGANPDKTKPETILPFLTSNTFNDQLAGFFARKVILVEGPSEYWALPNYFLNAGFDLVKNGVELINCQGKEQIARNYRLFTAYNIPSFCLFDADAKEESDKRANVELGGVFGFDPTKMVTGENDFLTDEAKGFGYFGKNFEEYMRATIAEYKEQESKIEGAKPLKAKVMSETGSIKPAFIEVIAQSLGLKKEVVEAVVEAASAPATPAPAAHPTVTNEDDIPF